MERSVSGCLSNCPISVCLSVCLLTCLSLSTAVSFFTSFIWSFMNGLSDGHVGGFWMAVSLSWMCLLLTRVFLYHLVKPGHASICRMCVPSCINRKLLYACVYNKKNTYIWNGLKLLSFCVSKEQNIGFLITTSHTAAGGLLTSPIAQNMQGSYYLCGSRAVSEPRKEVKVCGGYEIFGVAVLGLWWGVWD